MNTSNFLKFDEVYLGLLVKELISKSKLNKSEINIIINSCVNFYIELVNQILKRFDFELKSYKSLIMISPYKIMNNDNNSFMEILKEFPMLISEKKQDLDTEFRELKFLNFEKMFEGIPEINLETFWKKISDFKRGDSLGAFPVLSKFVQQIMILPHSSANVERIFSQVNINKTKCRNYMENESLQGILFTKDYLKFNNANCFDVEIERDLVKMLNSDIYV